MDRRFTKLMVKTNDSPATTETSPVSVNHPHASASASQVQQATALVPAARLSQGLFLPELELKVGGCCACALVRLRFTGRSFY